MAPTATTSSRPGCPPVTWPTSSSTTTARCCRRLKPEQNLTPLDDQPWASQLDPTFADSTKGSTASCTAVRSGTAFGGGVLYNIPVYKKLDLQIPKTWDEFMKNNADHQEGRRHRPGRADLRRDLDLAAVRARRLSTTSQAQVPDFAEKYTAGQAKYATTPAALAGFQHIQEVNDAGYFNKDFASAKLNDGVKAVATGKAAQYPQLGGYCGQHRERRSGQVERRRLLRRCPARTRRRTA